MACLIICNKVFLCGSLTVIILASSTINIQAETMTSNQTQMPLLETTQHVMVTNVSSGEDSFGEIDTVKMTVPDGGKLFLTGDDPRLTPGYHADVTHTMQIRCPAYGDENIYWESVPPGKYGKPCPDKIFSNFPESVKAYRICLDTGEWWGSGNDSAESSINGITDYNACIDYFKERIRQMMKHYHIVNTLQKVGWSLSLTALILGIIIFVYFKKLRVPRNYIHINLFISFVLLHVSVLITEEIVFTTETKVPVHCRVVSTISHFAILANYHWLLMEGVYLYSLLSVAVLSERSRLELYIGIGWGGPLVVIIAWVLAHRKIELSEIEDPLTLCWMSITEFKTYWILDVPIMFTIVLNTILFLLILCVIRDKLKTSTTSETKKVIKLARSTMVLIPLFGLYHVIFLVIREDMGNNLEMVKIYFELVLGSVQGLLVAVLYCFMNGEVRQEIGRKWRLHKLNRALSTHRSLRDVNSRVSYSNHGGTRNESVSEPVRNPSSNNALSLRSKLLNFRISALTSSRNSPGEASFEINGNMRRNDTTNVDEMNENETRIVNLADDYGYNSDDGEVMTALCERTDAETTQTIEIEADETFQLHTDHSNGETIV